MRLCQPYRFLPFLTCHNTIHHSSLLRPTLDCLIFRLFSACFAISIIPDSNQSGQLSCKSPTVCSTGIYASQAPTATTDRLCLACSSACATCVGPQPSQCTSCPSATTPTFLLPSGGLDSGPCLTTCPVTHYASARSTGACVLLAPCLPGQMLNISQTATSDRVCLNCSPGSSDGDSNPFTACTVCSPGSYSTGGQVGPCPACGVGLYQAHAGESVCRACSSGVCSGQQYRQVCQAASDSTCASCRVCTVYASVCTNTSDAVCGDAQAESAVLGGAAGVAQWTGCWALCAGPGHIAYCLV